MRLVSTGAIPPEHSLQATEATRTSAPRETLDLPVEAGADSQLGYCGVCRDWYEVRPDVSDRCPLCGYRAGDL